MSDLLIKKTACISECGVYRYRLTRQWSEAAPLIFIMLNPSTADAEIDDPTIRRCMGFARREGAGGIIVVNLFALRATNPSCLRVVPDPFGPKNEAELNEMAMSSVENGSPIICAWGSGGTIRDAHASAVGRLQLAGAFLFCLGMTRDGHPRHPLYVRADQPFVRFP